MSVGDLSNFDPSFARDPLVARLGHFRRKVRLHVGVAGSARVIAEIAMVAIASYLLDRLFRLGLAVRLAILIVAASALGYEIWRLLIAPMLARTSDMGLALALDRKDVTGPPIAPRVATVLELGAQLDSPSPPSPAMVRSAVLAASQSLENVDFEARLDRRRFNQRLGVIAAIVLLFGALTAAFPATAGLWAKRWFLASSQSWPQKTYLKVAGLVDGKLRVPRGEPTVLMLHAQPGSVEPDAIRLRLHPANAKRIDATMIRFGQNDFRYDLPPVQEVLMFTAEGGDDYIGPITVEPIDRPRLARLQLISQHPTEPKPTVHAFDSDATDFAFLPKTSLRLEIVSSVPVTQLRLGEAIEKVPGVDVKQIDATHFVVAWTHTRAMNFQIELVSGEMSLSSSVLPLVIGLKTDLPPHASLGFTGVRQRITPTATIPFTLSARDDYGINAVELAVTTDYLDAEQKRQTASKQSRLFGPQKPAVETDVQLPSRFSVATLSPPVGALVSFAGVATDDRYESPQTAKSREATFRIVAPEELFREILVRQQGDRAKFRKDVEEASSIRQDLATLNTPQIASALSRRHRALQREVSRVAVSLAESLTEMRLNALGGPEANDLMERGVIVPLKSLNDDLMTVQRDALDGLMTEAQPDAAAAIARQDQIVTKMNEILHQMAQWDSFVDVLNQLNEIIRLQEQAKQKTDQLRAKEADSVFDK